MAEVTEPFYYYVSPTAGAPPGTFTVNSGPFSYGQVTYDLFRDGAYTPYEPIATPGNPGGESNYDYTGYYVPGESFVVEADPDDPNAPANQYVLFSTNGNLSGTITTTFGNYVACLLRGTRIATEHGETPVESLVIGDQVRTASGTLRPIKWIGRRAYAGRFADTNPDVLPVTIRAGALADGVPSRDLAISPRHALFLEGVLIPAAALVNGASVTQADHVDTVEYFNIELDTHDSVLADGVPVETFVDDNSRAMFHNAHEFHALYPGQEPAEPTYIAPRVETGYALETVRRCLAERAGLPVAPARPFGTLLGWLDGCTATAVHGWAQDTMYPDAPVCLDIVLDGTILAQAYADQFRPDLLAAGIGTGHHAFTAALPTPLAPGQTARIVVRRSADAAPLARQEHAAAA